MVGVTGIGSWPGQDVREVLRVVRDELAEPPAAGVDAVPHLPELPHRGPGADVVGRSAALLVGLPVDLQPHGWRLVDRPGRDADRAAAYWRRDLDELAEVFDGWAGPFKVQVAGPWTLAAGTWLPLGERVLADPGATRDLTASLAEGVAEHVSAVRRLLPGAEPVLQLDEPSLPAVLRGQVRSDSGYRALPAPDPAAAQEALARVLAAAGDAGATATVLHCCDPSPPLPVLRGAGPDALALDVTSWGPRRWESAAATIEAGVSLWAGLLPGDQAPADVPAAVQGLVSAWHDVGLDRALLAALTVTPTCGLAGASPGTALAVTRATREAAALVAEDAEG